MSRDLRVLAQDLQRLQRLYPRRPADRAQRVLFVPDGGVVCINGVSLGVNGYQLGDRPVEEINLMLRIPDLYPLELPGDHHQPEFGIPANLNFKGQTIGNVFGVADWSDKNWAWVCVMFDRSLIPEARQSRSLLQSVCLLIERLRQFAQTGQ